MELLTDQQWSDLYASCTVSAVHLEMRDTYAVPDELDRIAKWKAGQLTDSEDLAWWLPWLEMTREMAGRGVTMRRVRVVSEPISDYIHYEWATARNHEGGEQSRWLPRDRASTLLLPGADFWLFDGHRVVFNHFTGKGDWAGNEVTDDPRAAELCATAFEATWTVAIPHGDYQPVLS